MRQQYVALIRGINVGGRNRVLMEDLRAVFGDAGYDDVRTYIQSGNVMFTTERPRAELAAHLAGEIEDRLGMSLVIAVRSHRQLRAIVDGAPNGFGRRPDEYHSDVIFLCPPLTTSAAMKIVDPREGVDEVWSGTNVLYFARFSAQRTRSRLSKIIGTPEYQHMTIRNWATTTKLLALMDDA